MQLCFGSRTKVKFKSSNVLVLLRTTPVTISEVKSIRIRKWVIYYQLSNVLTSLGVVNWMIGDYSSSECNLWVLISYLFSRSVSVYFPFPFENEQDHHSPTTTFRMFSFFLNFFYPSSQKDDITWLAHVHFCSFKISTSSSSKNGQVSLYKLKGNEETPSSPVFP